MKREEIDLGQRLSACETGGKPLSGGEIDLLPRDLALRESLEAQLTAASEYMTFEYSEMERRFEHPTGATPLLLAAANFTDAAAKYLVLRDQMLRMGFQPAPCPEWYSKLQRQAREAEL